MPYDNASQPAQDQPQPIAPALLRAWPLPQPKAGGDKDTRGRVLVVGGGPEMPGAIMLAATAALRSGAGKLQIATCRSIAPHVAVAVPEARVFGLPETAGGAIDPSAADLLAESAQQVEALVIGPGMIDEVATHALLKRLLPRISSAVLVLDAIALSCAVHDQHPLLDQAEQRNAVILTPHAGEMAALLGIDKAAVTADTAGIARRAAAQLRAVVALKGGDTLIATPEGALYQYHSGNIGLATSGSGDTLAGVIAGLAARGAPPLHATAWGVYLHGQAGNRLAKRLGQLGFLARELLDEIPPLMNGVG